MMAQEKMLAMVSSARTVIATGPLLWNISTKALPPPPEFTGCEASGVSA
jgi:hypothetical protein